MNRKQAQVHADRIRAFRQELEALQGKGMLSLSATTHEVLDTLHAVLLRRLAVRLDGLSFDRIPSSLLAEADLDLLAFYRDGPDILLNWNTNFPKGSDDLRRQTRSRAAAPTIPAISHRL